MTALLTADEAARLAPGEQLVIVRAGDPARPLSTATAPYDLTPVAPHSWVALTGPCATCGGVKPDGIFNEHWNCVGLGATPFGPYCRDGRRIVPLYTDHCTRTPYCDGGHVPFVVGRGSIEVVPVVAYSEQPPPAPCIVVDNYGAILVAPDLSGQPLNFDPLPVPGRDYGIVIDCMEVNAEQYEKMWTTFP